jgi:hypothetical protein
MTINDLVLYVSLSIPWGIAGWLAGYTAGYKAVLWSRTMPTTIERPTETPSKNSEDGRPWYRRTQTWTGAAVAAIGLVTGLQWFLGGAETRRVAEETHRLAVCQSAYASGFADAIEARADETRTKDDAIDGAFIAFEAAFKGTIGRPEVEAAISKYNTARAAQKKAQAENPYPMAPRDLCK